MRIAIFGGTFDPPHNGHLKLAENVLKQGICDRICFVPAWIPPHKERSGVTAFEHRLAMLNLAVEPHPGMNVSDVECVEKRVPSYTIDTMRSLKRAMPDDELCLLIGSDSLMQLHTWYKAGELVAEFGVLTYPRPGAEPQRLELLGNWPRDRAEALMAGVLSELDEFDLSSTAVRDNTECGLAGMVPAGVAEYIKENSLYKAGE